MKSPTVLVYFSSGPKYSGLAVVQPLVVIDAFESGLAEEGIGPRVEVALKFGHEGDGILIARARSLKDAPQIAKSHASFRRVVARKRMPFQAFVAASSEPYFLVSHSPNMPSHNAICSSGMLLSLKVQKKSESSF